jgi:hypothetical protein
MVGAASRSVIALDSFAALMAVISPILMVMNDLDCFCDRGVSLLRTRVMAGQHVMGGAHRVGAACIQFEREMLTRPPLWRLFQERPHPFLKTRRDNRGVLPG